MHVTKIMAMYRFPHNHRSLLFLPFSEFPVGATATRCDYPFHHTCNPFTICTMLYMTYSITVEKSAKHSMFINHYLFQFLLTAEWVVNACERQHLYYCTRSDTWLQILVPLNNYIPPRLSHCLNCVTAVFLA